MPLSTGTRLGSYEILAPIGAGGMGEVYRARDTKLKRDVAIKILPDAFARDRERMTRFQREAEVLASLNHPNIAAIYGVEDRALVMEFVEGAPPKGPLPVDEAWKIASQIAAALEYAHDKGIVHRDLKPANIMITPEGVVKLLDFGLAKAFTNQREPSASPENSPTLTMGATEVGVILGTAAYMSPEQARGKQVDKRADIWSFGVVLYELLTGERLFTGEDAAEILAAVIHKQPDFSKVPREARRLLEECLQKDPKQRLRDIGDAKRLLSRDGDGAEPIAITAPSQSRLGKLWPTAAALFALAAMALGFVSYRHVREEPPRVMKTSVLPPDKSVISSSGIPMISPDGRRVAFVATLDGKNEVWVRELDSLTARVLPGTDGAFDPFWSPDSRSIGFFAGAKLKRIDVAGGPAQTLCDAAAGRGGSWNQNNVIVFGVNNGGIFRVPAAGGTATPATTPDRSGGEVNHRFPWFLPDGHHFLFAAQNADPERVAMEVGDLDSKQVKHIASVYSNAEYAPPGYLLLVREGTLMAQPFDAGKLQTTGDAVPIAEQINTGGTSAQNQFSVSQNGVLVYTSGGRAENVQLTWFDRGGKVAGTVGAPGNGNWAAISPDGKTVAFDRRDSAGNLDIWLHDLARGTESRFTFGPRGSNAWPVWSPDGSRIAFYSNRDGLSHAFQKATSGAAVDEDLGKPLGSPPQNTRVDDWSRDGRYLIEETTGGGTTSNDIWVVPLFGDRKPIPYLQTQFTESRARLSPDGRWLAYQSNESKRDEVYVQTFPTPGGKWQVSLNGGGKPVWGPDGKELYFVGADSKLMAVEVRSAAGKFEASVPKPLFEVRIMNDFNSRCDVSADGRFLVPMLVGEAAAVPLTVVQSWQALLKK